MSLTLITFFDIVFNIQFHGGLIVSLCVGGAPKFVCLGDCCICPHGVRLGHIWPLARSNILGINLQMIVYRDDHYLK